MGYNLLARASRHGTIHSSNAANKPHTKHKPRVRAHEPEAPAVHMQGARSNTNHSDAKASVHERVVEVFALKRRHTAVLARFAVEDQIYAELKKKVSGWLLCGTCGRLYQGSSKDARAVQQALAHVALRHGVVGRLLVASAEGLLEPRHILRRRNRGFGGPEEVRVGLEWRVVESAEGEGLRGTLSCLSQGRRDGEWSPEERRHGWGLCVPVAGLLMAVQWRRPCGDIGSRFRLDDVLECARIAAKVRFKSEGTFRSAPDLNSSPLRPPRRSGIFGLLSDFLCSAVDNAPSSIFHILNVMCEVQPLTSLEHRPDGAKTSGWNISRGRRSPTCRLEKRSWT